MQVRSSIQRQSAAQAFKSEAEVAGKLQEQLRQASWASFNQAERQFQLGEWREGIALLARAIKFDSENRVVSERFFQELIVHRDKALPLLIASFAHQGTVNDAAFSPDGTRILTASADHSAKLWDAAGNADQACPMFPGTVARYHWGFEDPAKGQGTDDEVLEAFRPIRDEIAKVFGAYGADVWSVTLSPFQGATRRR
jgi:WD40 repeat protein